MKKTAKKSVPAKVKTSTKTKKKSAAKPVKKAKAAPKKAKSVTQKKASRTKAIAKKTAPAKKKPAVKAKPPVQTRPAVKTKPSPRPMLPVPVAPPPPPPAPTLPSSGAGTRDNPWILKTPSGGSEFQAFRDAGLNPPALVVRVGSTELRYHLRCIEDLHEWLKSSGDWMLLGGTDEQKPVVEGTVEAWARSPMNPVGGWYGLKSGLRGRFGVYVPPVLEVLGLAEVEHFPRDNRMRAKSP